MKIASWNVNSVRARLPRVLEWLAESKPDVALLQETKTLNEGFPALEIGELGYNLALSGQKTFNGVAILSRLPIEDIRTGLPGNEADEQCRYIEAVVGGARVASIYLPNGNPAPGPKFDYKLAWMAHLKRHIETLLPLEEPLVLGGDYNLCPADEDVYDPASWQEDALCRPESRRLYRAIVNLGLTDALRVFHDGPGIYTFWDYQAGAWQKDHGLRIDHLLLSPEAADRLKDAGVDRLVRAREKASDHVPVWCELDLD
jgi:exodeoxyribonuclease-3